MLRNVQVGGFYLKSGFGGSEIEHEGGLHVSGGIGSNGLASRQYQPIPSPNPDFAVRNCTLTLMHFGKGGSEDLQSFGPCPNSSSAIQFSDTKIYNPSGKTTVCKLRWSTGRHKAPWRVSQSRCSPQAQMRSWAWLATCSVCRQALFGRAGVEGLALAQTQREAGASSAVCVKGGG
jgi:hypothetical protein